MVQVKTGNESSAYAFAAASPTPLASGQQMHPMALAEYQHRLQLYDYAQQAAIRLRLTQSALASSQQATGPAAVFGMSAHPALADSATSPFAHISPFARFDPRFRYVHEEPKPPHSYIGLIAMAILSSGDKKMVLSDIYQYILDHYPYFRNRGPGWRNSIRHNLSLNDCFVKAGRSANGKGHYWAIHPANVEDFRKGDFRRRKAQRKVRKHMGLSVPEDEDSSSPTPTPVPTPLASPFIHSRRPTSPPDAGVAYHPPQMLTGLNPMALNDFTLSFTRSRSATFRPDLFDGLSPAAQRSRPGKRQFDVESLLAPDCDSTVSDVNACVDAAATTETKSEGASTDIAAANGSPRCSHSPSEFAKSDSNCSSPSLASSTGPSPQPLNVVRQDDAIEGTSGGGGKSEAGVYGRLSQWQVAQIQSLQSLHQMNAGLRCESGFAAWAAMSALANSQAAPANLLSYSAFAAASIGGLSGIGSNSEHATSNSSSPVVAATSSACNQNQK